MNDSSLRFETRCVHTGVDKDSAYNSATTPIYPSSTFYWDDLNTTKGYDYTRSGNPTRSALEENLASLEGGIACRATCTGMAAVTAALHLFKAGDHIIAGNDIYGGTYRLMADVIPGLGLETTFVNMRDLDEIKAAIRPNTKGMWIETPSNPLMNLTDVRAVTALAREHNLTTIADNTFLSPYFQRPIELGVDVVMHSTTKYLNGHSDVVGGALITSKEEHAERIAYVVNAMGLACSPFDAWLVLRGVKTLGPRMEVHERNANSIARFLAEHPKVTKVYYPGLPDHPQHELAKSQQSGFGAIISCELAGDGSYARSVLTRAKLFLLAESLGGVESLWEYPDSMTHASMTEAARRHAGITPNTIRLSIGIEAVDDLIADLTQALDV
ncbi:trans-sulfuration enzyme family protein [Calycomorphotria hydatis]|uniref:Cystathionine gamma-synthase n=1 Tax=Calycomorphotria hydatis TaxID=2528027 RepID=A0A517TCK1_9PLAN|nr:PLP-dependent aspartate aminotransferase family protein [Calycomorphotria hydatis]QDT66107.1 Cystathionine gamma-synthase [Calycomorphotria hydatis]